MAWSHATNAPFPLPAHRTGRADFPHPALRPALSRDPRRFVDRARHMHDPLAAPSSRDVARTDGSCRFAVLSDTRSITSASSSSRARRKSGSFPLPALPGFIGTTALSDSRHSRRPKSAPRPLPSLRRVSPIYPQHLSNVPFPIPRWTKTGASVGFFPISRGLLRSIGGSAPTTSLSRPAQASLALRPAGLLSRLTRPLSQGFGPGQSPSRTACQLPELPTPVWVDPSSTGVTRPRGALWIPGLRKSASRE